MNALVDRAHFDAPLRLLESDLALNGLERDEARSAAHFDVAAVGFHGDVPADVFHRDIRVVAGDRHGHPRRHADRVVERAHLAAAHRTRPHCHCLLGLFDVHDLAVGVVHFDAHGVLVPHLDVDVAREVVHVELRAFGHGDGLIRRRERHHGEDDFCKHSPGPFSPSCVSPCRS